MVVILWDDWDSPTQGAHRMKKIAAVLLAATAILGTVAVTAAPASASVTCGSC